MVDSEDPLEQARRHVAEAERRVAEQAELVKGLRADGHVSAAAEGEQLLVVFEQTLTSMREHLALEQREAERKRN